MLLVLVRFDDVKNVVAVAVAKGLHSLLHVLGFVDPACAGAETNGQPQRATKSNKSVASGAEGSLGVVHPGARQRDLQRHPAGEEAHPLSIQHAGRFIVHAWWMTWHSHRALSCTSDFFGPPSRPHQRHCAVRHSHSASRRDPAPGVVAPPRHG